MTPFGMFKHPTSDELFENILSSTALAPLPIA
jgi:hypothetical protein